MNDKIRRHIYFSGTVQGVGFRYRCRQICDYLGLTGWVRNCFDGCVEMEVQGTSRDISELVSTLRDQRWIRIDSVESSDVPLEDNETSFRVIG